MGNLAWKLLGAGGATLAGIITNKLLVTAYKKAGKDFDAPFRKATDVLARMRYGSRTAA